MKTMACAFSMILFLGVQSGEACDVPAEYPYRATVVQGNLIVTLALNQSTYVQGQPISSYLGIENAGTDTVWACAGQSPINIFGIMADSCVSLQQTCIDSSLFFHPSVVYYFGECIRILPGECEVRLVDWDGWLETFDLVHHLIIRTLPAPGSYVALAGIYQTSGSGMHFVIPVDGITLPITIEQGTPLDVQATSWGHLKGLFSN
jgi:hypothetical protein